MFNFLWTDKTKGPLSSLGIVGPVTGFIVMVGGFWFGDGVVTSEDVTTVTSKIDDMFIAGAAVCGTLTAVIGRWRATKMIGGGELT